MKMKSMRKKKSEKQENLKRLRFFDALSVTFRYPTLLAAVAPSSSFTIVCCRGSEFGLHLSGKHLFDDFFRINMKDLDSVIIGRDRCGSGVGGGGSVGLLLHALCDGGLLR
ncbi:hypothetical protein L6452_00378 [Arctium lappa]|uniref:Uncharacterized protein n=1 Tax=Arctium lappa TaxID=4217 RepID=A0ACB9FDP4_ARCLA|nr:hypothetical protein L6452_00378 [Arctium lappa]